MMMKLIKKIIPTITNLSHKNIYLSVNNYMKTYQPHQITRYHGIFRIDQFNQYDKDQVQVMKFIKRQRQIYNTESNKWKQYTQQYYKIVSSRKDNRTTTIPQPYDMYQYFTKIDWKNGRQYTKIYRKAINQSQKQQLVLDIMQYPQISTRYSKTVALLQTSFSPSHRYVAFAVDLRNNEKSYFYIADTHNPKRQLLKIKTEGDSNFRIEQVKDLIFTSENEIYYVKSQNFRPHKIYYHNIQTGQISEVLHQADPQFYLSLKKSKDKRYLIITGQSRTKSKIWILDTQQKKKQIIKICEQTGRVFVDHVQDHFIYWVQNQQSCIKLINDSQLKVNNRQRQSLSFKKMEHKILHTCLEQEIIEQIDIIKNNIILYIEKINRPILRIINYQHDKEEKEKYSIDLFDAQLPYSYGSIMPQTNQSYNSDNILFSISTPFVYKEVYQYSVTQRKYNVLEKFQPTGPKINIAKYQIKSINVPSATMDYIPMTLISPKNKSIGKLILNTYGFYGISTKITYDNVNIAALQKGWTIAYAHIRGGGQKGRKWHKQSLRQNRDRTWKDIEQCVGYLIKEQYTHPSLLFIHTNSAGAIAAWNTINRKPHLYKGVIMRYPFLDVLTSLMDSSQPLSNADYQQFGNPIESKLIYNQIQAISPYENISTKQYPAIHIIAGQNDYRTPIGQIAKFVDKFRIISLQNERFFKLGIKGLTVDISSSASHLGESNIKDENYKGCQMFGYMDYVIKKISKDCQLKQD